MTDSTPFDVRMPLTSHDVVQDRMDRLRELFPEAFAEGKIDFDKLRQVLGENIDAGRPGGMPSSASACSGSNMRGTEAPTSTPR